MNFTSKIKVFFLEIKVDLGPYNPVTQGWPWGSNSFSGPTGSLGPENSTPIGLNFEELQIPSLLSDLGLIFSSNPRSSCRFEPEPSGGAVGPGFSYIVELAFLNRSASSFLSSAFSLPRYECLKCVVLGFELKFLCQPEVWDKKTRRQSV